MRRAAMVVLSAAVLVLAPLGCGEDEAELTDSEVEIVQRAGGAIAWGCGGGEIPTASVGALRGLVRIYREKPEAEFRDRTLRQVIADYAVDMEACGSESEQSRYEADLLRAALDSGP